MQLLKAFGVFIRLAACLCFVFFLVMFVSLNRIYEIFLITHFVEIQYWQLKELIP